MTDRESEIADRLIRNASIAYAEMGGGPRIASRQIFALASSVARELARMETMFHADQQQGKGEE